MEFRRDPLSWFDAAMVEAGDTVRLPGGRICVVSPMLARRVLGEVGASMAEHSDFFSTSRGVFGPRRLQISVAAEARELIARALDEASDRAPVADATPWPAAGTLHFWRCTRSALYHPQRSAEFGAHLDGIVRRRILLAQREHGWDPRRWLRRQAIVRAFARERRAGRDVQDVFGLIASASDGSEDQRLLEVFLAFVFGAVSSLGLTLSWSVLLALRHDRTASPRLELVQEALRLYPVAWLFERRCARALELDGQDLAEGEAVWVSTYAAHRHRNYWPDGDAFQPERWAGRVDRRNYLPFGAGAHGCVATDLSLRVCARSLDAMLATGPRLAGDDGKPVIGAALRPPVFYLTTSSALRRHRAE